MERLFPSPRVIMMLHLPLSVRNGYGQAFLCQVHGSARQHQRLATILQRLGFVAVATTPHPSDACLPPSAVLALVRSCLPHQGRGMARAVS